jgi:hypothetical protein
LTKGKEEAAIKFQGHPASSPNLELPGEVVIGNCWIAHQVTHAQSQPLQRPLVAGLRHPNLSNCEQSILHDGDTVFQSSSWMKAKARP